MKKLLALSLIALLAGCATGPRIDKSLTAKSQSSRVKFVVLHYTVANLPSSIKILTEQTVSSHYLLTDEKKPVIYGLVDETRQSNHAGVSSWKNYTLLNTSSIGIEIVNPGHSLGYPGFPKRQINAVIGLCSGIIRRHSIPAHRVLAHSDVAPGRKVDPGEKFPWRALFEAGVGHLVPAAPIRRSEVLKAGDAGTDVEALQSMLTLYGYGVEITGGFDRQTEIVVEAFQRHFRPRRVDGLADSSTIRTLQRLLASVTVIAAK